MLQLGRVQKTELKGQGSQVSRYFKPRPVFPSPQLMPKVTAPVMGCPGAQASTGS